MKGNKEPHRLAEENEYESDFQKICDSVVTENAQWPVAVSQRIDTMRDERTSCSAVVG